MNHINIKDLSFYQQLSLAVLTLIIGCTAGYTVSEVDSRNIDDINIDIFSIKAKEVNEYINEVLANPTERNLRNANNHLKISIKSFEEREYGDNKELFHEYRLACQDVIDGYQAGDSEAQIKVKTDKMNNLYNELN